MFWYEKDTNCKVLSTPLTLGFIFFALQYCIPKIFPEHFVKILFEVLSLSL